MEIVSYILDGILEHKDSLGHGSQMRAGDVQLMSAGKGVTHSEFNASADEPLEFLQMWVLPQAKGTEPRYEQKAFPIDERRGRLRLVVSPDGHDGSLTIDQDARLFAGVLSEGDNIQHELSAGRAAWLHVVRGKLRLNEFELGPGDGAAIRNELLLRFRGLEDVEFVLWDLAASPE